MKSLLCYKWLVLCITFPLCAAELNLADMGVTLNLVQVESLDVNLISLTLPDNTKVQVGKKQKTNIAISDKPLVLKGQSRKYPSFTKVLIKQVSNELLIIKSFYSDDPNKEILPEQFVTVGIRYPAMAEVVPNTPDKIDYKDVVFFRPENTLSLFIGRDGRAQATLAQKGDWIVAVRSVDPKSLQGQWQKMKVTKIMNEKRQPLKMSNSTTPAGRAQDTQLIDTIITTHKIIKAEMNYQIGTIGLMVRP